MSNKLSKKDIARVYELHQYLGMHKLTRVSYMARPEPGVTFLAEFYYCDCGLVTRHGSIEDAACARFDADLIKNIPENTRKRAICINKYLLAKAAKCAQKKH